MGIEEVKRIQSLFQTWKVEVSYLEHEPVLTSEDAAKTRGFALKQGIKAIVLTNGKNEWLIVNVPADEKVNLKAVAEQKTWSKGKTRMATSEEVLEKTGCHIGAVPPFGHKEKITIFVDKTIFENEYSAFNIGLRTHSVKIQTKDMRKVFQELKAIEGDFII